jgi:hypothetical protein
MNQAKSREYKSLLAEREVETHDGFEHTKIYLIWMISGKLDHNEDKALDNLIFATGRGGHNVRCFRTRTSLVCIQNCTKWAVGRVEAGTIQTMCYCTKPKMTSNSTGQSLGPAAVN